MFTTWRYRRFHVSYVLGWFSAAVLIGLVAGRIVPVVFDAAVLSIVLLLILGALRSRRWYSIMAIIAAGMLIGMVRGGAVDSRFDTYGSLIGQQIILTGRIVGDPQISSDTRTTIAVGSVSIAGQAFPGEVYVALHDNPKLKRGDYVDVSGKVKPGFAFYGAALSAGEIKQVSRDSDTIRDLRDSFGAAIRTGIAEPMASLGLGFVVGQRSALPEELDEQLKVVGLTHIVVASGYNLTILVRFMMRLISRHSRYLALVSSLVAIVLFALFSGFSPSMTRAVLVTILGLLAWYVGRRFHPVLLLGYVAAVTAFWNPQYIWSDLGWYLSFFAFAGVLIVAPLIVRGIYRKRTPTPFEQLVFETMGAEIMALPLIALIFGTLPALGLLANILVGPFIPTAMALTVLAGLATMALTPLGLLVALPATILMAYMVAVVEWLAALPFAEQAVSVGVLSILLWYFLIAALVATVAYRMGYNFRAKDSKLDL